MREVRFELTREPRSERGMSAVCITPAVGMLEEGVEPSTRLKLTAASALRVFLLRHSSKRNLNPGGGIRTHNLSLLRRAPHAVGLRRGNFPKAPGKIRTCVSRFRRPAPDPARPPERVRLGLREKDSNPHRLFQRQGSCPLDDPGKVLRPRMNPARFERASSTFARLRSPVR
jgi:hypothetical protein